MIPNLPSSEEFATPLATELLAATAETPSMEDQEPFISPGDTQPDPPDVGQEVEPITDTLPDPVVDPPNGSSATLPRDQPSQGNIQSNRSKNTPLMPRGPPMNQQAPSEAETTAARETAVPIDNNTREASSPSQFRRVLRSGRSHDMGASH